jgi:hypothetical protein
MYLLLQLDQSSSFISTSSPIINLHIHSLGRINFVSAGERPHFTLFAVIAFVFVVVRGSQFS